MLVRWKPPDRGSVQKRSVTSRPGEHRLRRGHRTLFGARGTRPVSPVASRSRDWIRSADASASAIPAGAKAPALRCDSEAQKRAYVAAAVSLGDRVGLAPRRVPAPTRRLGALTQRGEGERTIIARRRPDDRRGRKARTSTSARRRPERQTLSLACRDQRMPSRSQYGERWRHWCW